MDSIPLWSQEPPHRVMAVKRGAAKGRSPHVTTRIYLSSQPSSISPTQLPTSWTHRAARPEPQPVRRPEGLSGRPGGLRRENPGNSVLKEWQVHWFA